MQSMIREVSRFVQLSVICC